MAISTNPKPMIYRKYGPRVILTYASLLKTSAQGAKQIWLDTKFPDLQCVMDRGHRPPVTVRQDTLVYGYPARTRDSDNLMIRIA